MTISHHRHAARFAVLLAWQQTWRRAKRSIGAFIGIAGAFMLILVQLGFQTALEESAVRIHRQLTGELVVVASSFQGLRDVDWFERSGLTQIHANPQIVSVSPLILEAILVRDPETHHLANIWCIGINLEAPAVGLAIGREDTQLLRLPGRVLFDSESRPRYGAVLHNLAVNGQARMLTAMAGALLQAELQIVGTYKLGATIAVEGTLLMSEDTLASILGRSRERLTMAVLKLAPGADPTSVAKQVQTLLPPTLRVFTVEELIAMEKHLWAIETPIGLIFNLCTAIGLAVCGIFVWQLLGQVIDENIDEYAVLRIMGYDNSFFRMVFLVTALLYTTAALPLAILLTLVADAISENLTHMDMNLTAGRVAFVTLAGLGTALLTGGLASLRLRRADPATLL